LCIEKGDVCFAGTIKKKEDLVGERLVTSCCAENNCNTGQAAADRNSLWCNFGMNLKTNSSKIYAQSCPKTGSCAVRKSKYLHFLML
jgi:hypothetical protein